MPRIYTDTDIKNQQQIKDKMSKQLSPEDRAEFHSFMDDIYEVYMTALLAEILQTKPSDLEVTLKADTIEVWRGVQEEILHLLSKRNDKECSETESSDIIAKNIRRVLAERLKVLRSNNN